MTLEQMLVVTKVMNDYEVLSIKNDWSDVVLDVGEDRKVTIWVDGGHVWFRRGVPHRDDGPAENHVCGGRYWVLNGQRVTQETHAIMMKGVKSKTS